MSFVAALAMSLGVSYANVESTEESASPAFAAPTSASTKAATNVSKPITDLSGRIRYIVDLVEDDANRPEIFYDANAKIAWHKASAQKLIDDATKFRGVDIVSSTSLVGTSFTAYLTPKQFDQFSKDKRVLRITQDAYLQPSALWNNSGTPPYQVRPWGLEAMGIYGGSSNGGSTVYVLDTGVESHADLPSLAWYDQLSVYPGINPTGCYRHATHVAGIIAAADNGFGVVGVNPNTRIVSIALGHFNKTSDEGDNVPCSDGYTVDAFVQGLEIIANRIQWSGRVAIVNISFNTRESTGLFRSVGTIGAKMKNVATPLSYYVGWYRGAFIVQSAGNHNEDACGYAYGPASSSDGIMVVGGIDENGYRVVPSGAANGYINMPTATDEPGSNWGSCVETWAPSQRLLSTWKQNGTKVLSGTSMAAPHVAGFAARLLDMGLGGITSVQLEAAVRARFATISSSNLWIPRLY